MKKLLILAVFALASCGLGWQGTVHKSLTAAHELAVQGRIVTSEVCHSKIGQCIATNDQQCAALERCNVAIKALDSTNRAVKVGIEALEKGDESAAQHALQTVLSTLVQVREILAIWGITL